MRSSTNTCGAIATTPLTGCEAAGNSTMRGAVAVPDQNRFHDAEPIQRRGQHVRALSCMNQTVRGCGGSPRPHILATRRAEYDRCVRMGDDAVRAVTFAG